MSEVNVPLDELLRSVEGGLYSSPKLDWDVLKFLGFYVVRNLLSPATVKKYLDIYRSDMESGVLKKNDAHLTEVQVKPGHALRDVIAEPEFLALASQFYGGQVGSDYVRVVKKDAFNQDPVFLHQDSSYQVGWLDRYSLFIALTPCHFDNGGLVLYPGTHHFGYLSDAGEIRDFLPDGYPRVKSSLEPGDVVVMHSCTWHSSPVNITHDDRVYLEVHLQNIDDPSTVMEVCGTRTSPWRLTLKGDDLFVNSRVQRLKSLYSERDTWRGTQTKS
ncbi:MAG: hypothetical protein EKK45_08605 [Curvibacter sp.]|nr:MAG: hypothetical protein EKK45_08605 [Curvibacter sp.]